MDEDIKAGLNGEKVPVSHKAIMDLRDKALVKQWDALKVQSGLVKDEPDAALRTKLGNEADEKARELNKIARLIGSKEVAKEHKYIWHIAAGQPAPDLNHVPNVIRNEPEANDEPQPDDALDVNNLMPNNAEHQPVNNHQPAL